MLYWPSPNQGNLKCVNRVQSFSATYNYIEKKTCKAFTHWHLISLIIFYNILDNFFADFSTVASTATSIMVSTEGKRGYTNLVSQEGFNTDYFKGVGEMSGNNKVYAHIRVVTFIRFEKTR